MGLYAYIRLNSFNQIVTTPRLNCKYQHTDIINKICPLLCNKKIALIGYLDL